MENNNNSQIEKLQDMVNYQVLPILIEIERLKAHVDEKTYKEIIEPLSNMIIKVKQK
jgi:hypothetical protein